LKTENRCIIGITHLPAQNRAVQRSPNFRLRLWLHHFKVFGPGSSHRKLLGLRFRNLDL